MTKPKKQLVLLVTTYKEPLGVKIYYTGSNPKHGHTPVMQRVLEFRLGELMRPTKRLAAANLARAVQLAGPWDVSAANEVGIEECQALPRGGSPEPGIERKLILGNKRVKEFFGSKRHDLFNDCVLALNRSDLAVFPVTLAFAVTPRAA